MSRGRDWNPSMPDAETMLTYDDEPDLSFSMPIRTMKGDSIVGRDEIRARRQNILRDERGPGTVEIPRTHTGPS